MVGIANRALTFRVMLVILVAIFVFAFLWFVPKWQVLSSEVRLKGETRIQVETDARKAWGQVFGIFGGLAILFFTWRRIEVAQEGQITERFTKAIDHLGATAENGRKMLEIRLGGIYALERIARDSKKDHWSIMEVLTAYVRENAPWPPKAKQVEENREAEKEEADRSLTFVEIPELPADIQAILTVLGRRTLAYKKGEDHRLDLSKTDIRGAQLAGANLGGAHLYGANLRLANLVGAHLEEANLRRAYLRLARLDRAQLEGAQLYGAHLEGAQLEEANLAGAQLEDAQLRLANLVGAHLEEANLRRAYLEEANLAGANLAGANLGEADLRLACLEEAQLFEAYLYGAHLEEANLAGARLAGADLAGANLAGASDLTIRQLSEVKTLCRGILDSELLTQIEKDYPHLLEEPLD